MQILLNQQRGIDYKKITNNKQSKFQFSMSGLTKDTVSFGAFYDVDFSTLYELKEEYKNKLNAAKDDDEKVELLHSLTGFVTRSPWDKSEHEKYNQPMIHKFNFTEITKILSDMSSNKARFSILMGPKYTVQFMGDPEIQGDYGIRYITYPCETDTRNRIVSAFTSDPYKQSAKQYEQDKNTIRGIISSIVKDKTISLEERVNLIDSYKIAFSTLEQSILNANVKDVEFSEEEMKYSKLFLDENNLVDWRPLIQSTEPEIIDLITQLKDDDSLSPESKTKILSANYTYAPIAQRCMLAVKNLRTGDREKHTQVVDTILFVTNNDYQQRLLTGEIPFVNYWGDDIPMLAKSIDYCCDYNTIDTILADEFQSPRMINRIVEDKYSELQKPSTFKELYSNLTGLDAKLGLMAAHYQPNIPEATLFKYHSKFCLDAMKELETEARLNNDEEALRKISRTKDDLYQRWEYEQTAGTFEDIKALIENAPDDKTKIAIIEGMTDPQCEKTDMRTSSRLMSLPVHILPQKVLDESVTPRLHQEFTEFENMKYVLEVLKDVQKNSKTCKLTDDEIKHYQSLLYDRYKEACAQVYRSSENLIQEKIKQFENYLGI